MYLYYVKSAAVHAMLVQALADATLLADSARMEFVAIRDDIPSGLPHPDGVQRIYNALCALTAAHDEMMRAHDRLNDFIERGIVPEVAKAKCEVCGVETQLRRTDVPYCVDCMDKAEQGRVRKPPKTETR